MSAYSIAIHGGAGPRIRGADQPNRQRAYADGLRTALEAGLAILTRGGRALDAVEQAVVALEDCELFNAGRGAVYTAEGAHELDASIMDGETLNAGAVAQLRGIKNPVRLARDVMQKSEHLLLAADGALKFADSLGYSREAADYFATPERFAEWQEAIAKQAGKATKPGDERPTGTVGAVACDAAGHLAAATSTGGLVNKHFGRVGDSPIIGAGNYANDASCAVSCTGSGEFFIRTVAAHDLACLIEYRGLTLAQAADEVIHKHLARLGGDGGLIAVDAHGNIAMPYNTPHMYRGCGGGQRELEVYV